MCQVLSEPARCGTLSAILDLLWLFGGWRLSSVGAPGATWWLGEGAWPGIVACHRARLLFMMHGRIAGACAEGVASGM